MAPRILVVDNYDSFVFTLVDYLERLGAQTEVFRNDAVPPLDHLGGRGTGAEQPYDGVLISPGPGNPRGAGASMQTIAYCAEHSVPMLGVCLGHQALAEVFGGTVTHAPQLRHGKTSDIHHNGQGIFASLPSPFKATRYHSLAVVPSTVPDVLEVTAWAGEVIMGLSHRTLPLHGVQFHPESILTDHGEPLIANWLTQTTPTHPVQGGWGGRGAT